MTRCVSFLILASGLCLTLAGCGGGGVVVEGKVVRNGGQVTLAENEGMTVNLVSEDGKTSASGKVEKSGTFTVAAADGKPIPSGKYKVSYVHYLPQKGKDQTRSVMKDTKEVWDVTPENKSFTVDIGKP